MVHLHCIEELAIFMISFVFTDEDVKFVDQFCLHLKSDRTYSFMEDHKKMVIVKGS